MYSFKPMTEEEINQALNSLAPDGTYDFEVVSSERKISSNNNPMAKLLCRYWDSKGQERIINAFLVFSNNPFNIRFVRHFCESVGLEKEFDQGQLREDLQGLKGKFIITTSKGKEIPFDKLNGKPIGSKYPDQNTVFDFVKFSPPLGRKLNPLPAVSNDMNDDIPF